MVSETRDKIKKKKIKKPIQIETRREEAGVLWEPRGQRAAGERCRLLRAHPGLPPGASRRREGGKAHVPLGAQAAPPAAHGPRAGQDLLGANRGRSWEPGDLTPNLSQAETQARTLPGPSGSAAWPCAFRERQHTILRARQPQLAQGSGSRQSPCPG